MRTGKSHFCRKFTEQTNNYEFIELDKERKLNPGKSRNEVLSEVVNKNKNKSYILEHYDLLNKNYFGKNTLEVWEKEADILIFLNPKREGIRNGFDYSLGAYFVEKFEKLNGKIIYRNIDTGTYVKCMNKSDKSNE